MVLGVIRVVSPVLGVVRPARAADLAERRNAPALIAAPAWAAGGDMPSLVQDIGISLLAAGTLGVIRRADGGEPITYASGRQLVRNVQLVNVMRAGKHAERRK